MDYHYAELSKHGWSRVLRHKCPLSPMNCSAYHMDMNDEDEKILDVLGSYSQADKLAREMNQLHWSERPWLNAPTVIPASR